MDEVDKLDLNEQALLLRVLERRAFREVGGESVISDVRLVVGTNANLEREMKARRFREDLYYRINAAPVYLPPLDDREDEILPWSTYMLHEVHLEHDDGAGRGEPTLTGDAAELLLAQRWPGNLRQLRHVIERSYLLARSDGEPDPVVVGRRHVEVALLLDRPDELRKRTDLQHHLADQLAHAARLGAQIILRRADLGEPPLPVSVWEGFAGMVVDAVRQLRPLDKASVAYFGLESQVAGGNYRKTYQRLQNRGHLLLHALLHRPTDPTVNNSAVDDTAVGDTGGV